MIGKIIHAFQNIMMSDKYQDMQQTQHVRNENIKSLINTKENEQLRSKVQQTKENQAIKTVDDENKREKDQRFRDQNQKEDEKKKEKKRRSGSSLKYLLEDSNSDDYSQNRNSEPVKPVGKIIDKKI